MKLIDFRAAIRQELKRRKMSVTALARQVDCGHMAIYNYMAGRTEMKADLLGKILTALEIELARKSADRVHTKS